MKQLLAVDVALLLPDGANALCRRINAALLESDPTGFAFDSSHVPHLTLVQLFVSSAHLSVLCRQVDSVLKGRPPLRLRALEAAVVPTTTHLRIVRVSTLRQIHEDLVNALSRWSEPSGDSRAFFSPGETVRDGDIEWVAQYGEAASFDKFDPHISLGAGGRTDVSVRPFSFTVDRVGLYQLGRFCTCRRQLQEWKLKPATRPRKTGKQF